jgi:hypothetical protein
LKGNDYLKLEVQKNNLATKIRYSLTSPLRKLLAPRIKDILDRRIRYVVDHDIFSEKYEALLRENAQMRQWIGAVEKHAGSVGEWLAQSNQTLWDHIRYSEKKVDFTLGQVEGLEPLFQEFQSIRQTESYKSAFVNSNPLVSVLIPTFNRANLLVTRSLPSVIHQTYKNLEIIIVGDGCNDDTEARIKSVSDPRIKFLNLPERGPYPPPGRERWTIAGLYAANKARELATGDFICNIDDDDEMLPDRVEKLVHWAQKEQADVVFHPFLNQQPDSSFSPLGSSGVFRAGEVTTSSVFYHGYFKKIHTSLDCYRYLEPGDWSRFRRILYLRPKISFYQEALVKHYREGSGAKPTIYPAERFLP